MDADVWLPWCACGHQRETLNIGRIHCGRKRLVVVRGRKKLVVGGSWLEVGWTPRQVSRRDLYNVTEITDKLPVTVVAQLYKLTERPPRQILGTGPFVIHKLFFS